MEDRTLILTNEKGEEITARILFTYHSDEFEKDYVVFFVPSDNQLSAACYNPNPENGATGELAPVETEEEWEMLQELLDDYTQEGDEGCGCGGSCDSCGGGCGGGCDCGGCEEEA